MEPEKYMNIKYWRWVRSLGNPELERMLLDIGLEGRPYITESALKMTVLDRGDVVFAVSHNSNNCWGCPGQPMFLTEYVREWAPGLNLVGRIFVLADYLYIPKEGEEGSCGDNIFRGSKVLKEEFGTREVLYGPQISGKIAQY